MIELLRALGATNRRFPSLDAFYEAFPRSERTANGGRANTLIIICPDGRTLSIRPFYETFVRWLRIENKRLDYPKAAPHATQSWRDYVHWLEGLLVLSDDELLSLEVRTREFVLEHLEKHVRNTSLIKREPLRFSLFLEQFDFSHQRGENTGAAYQGAVFGYIRADAAHLQVETASVRTGGKRENRIGDIDAVNGDSLVIAAEVKQSVLQEDDVPEFEELATQVFNEGAMGLVVALDFAAGVREKIQAMGLEPVSKNDLLYRVRLWDSLKQKVAVDALIYYVTRIEHNTPLKQRVNRFFEAIEASGVEIPGADCASFD